MKAFRRLLMGCTMFAILASGAAAAPLGTGFTYQGQLDQNGSPVTGTVNMRFSLYDAATGGTQIGSSQTLANVLATGGIFTTLINAGGEFGPTAFNGDARWLQVEVCTDAVCTTATILSPRQVVTGSPYALDAQQTQLLRTANGGLVAEILPGASTNSPGLYANRASQELLMGNVLEGGLSHGFLSIGYTSIARKFSIGRASSGDFSTAVFDPLLTVVSNTGNVGLGVASPAFPLSFPASLGEKVAIYSTPAGGANYGIGVQSNLFQIHTDASAADIAFGYGSSASFTEQMRVKGTGNVGIGTSNPTTKLEVRGDISMGTNGDDYATRGSENLRIVRGTVNGAGTGGIEYGSGFSVVTEANFVRKITFNTPFSSPPTIVATSVDCVGCFVRMCEIITPVSSSFVRVSEYNRHDGSYSGGQFNFIAIGPR